MDYGEILRNRPLPAIELRASIIIGSGSLSYVIVPRSRSRTFSLEP